MLRSLRGGEHRGGVDGVRGEREGGLVEGRGRVSGANRSRAAAVGTRQRTQWEQRGFEAPWGNKRGQRGELGRKKRREMIGGEGWGGVG